MSIKYFLRNEGPSSQKRTFARRQWIQHVLFLFFSQHVFQSIWPWVFDVKQLFSQKWNLDTESNPAWKSPLLSKEVFVYVFSKRTAYKMKNICFFKLLELQGFQKPQLLSKKVFALMQALCFLSGQLTNWTKLAFSRFSSTMFSENQFSLTKNNIIIFCYK